MGDAERVKVYRAMLASPPWELAAMLYPGGIGEMAEWFEELRAELARLEARQGRGEEVSAPKQAA